MKEIPNLDILLVVLLTVLFVMLVVIPGLNIIFIRSILGLLLILFLPGYSLIIVLFPKNESLDGIERLSLSFGLSIVISPLIGLLLNYTPFGIRLIPILISLSILTILMCFIAYIRRFRLQDDDKFTTN